MTHPFTIPSHWKSFLLETLRNAPTPRLLEYRVRFRRNVDYSERIRLLLAELGSRNGLRPKEARERHPPGHRVMHMWCDTSYWAIAHPPMGWMLADGETGFETELGVTMLVGHLGRYTGVTTTKEKLPKTGFIQI